MEDFKDKFKKINQFIYDSRYNTLKKGAEHIKFLNEKSTKKEEIEDAKLYQNKMNYSHLETDIADLQESLKNTKDFSNGTIR